MPVGANRQYLFYYLRVGDMTCFGCIKKRVCYLANNDGSIKKDTLYDDEEIGWCEKCNICPEQGCQKQYAFRVNWTVGLSQDPYHMIRDVCNEHAKSTPTDYECAKTARDRTLQSYVYSKKTADMH